MTASWNWITTRPNAACASSRRAGKPILVGSEAGAKAAAFACTLVETAKRNAVDPCPWLAETRTRFPDGKINSLLPWRWNR
ncbi:transposase domain-containing protein [Paracoccus bogoriensis]|uniref:transposase domain-containing protein n=1 Tax=Paracoccus bogoriensis TaxID=242065 RepID=UPI003CCED508